MGWSGDARIDLFGVRKSGDEDNFAVRAGGENVDVSLSSVLQWDLFADDRPKSFIFEACVDAGEHFLEFDFGGGPQSETANGCATGHEVARIDGEFAAIADDD